MFSSHFLFLPSVLYLTQWPWPRQKSVSWNTQSHLGTVFSSYLCVSRCVCVCVFNSSSQQGHWVASQIWTWYIGNSVCTSLSWAYLQNTHTHIRGIRHAQLILFCYWTLSWSLNFLEHQCQWLGVATFNCVCVCVCDHVFSLSLLHRNLTVGGQCTNHCSTTVLKTFKVPSLYFSVGLCCVS